MLFPVLLVASTLLSATFEPALAKKPHVWEKVEITLRSEKSYENPYKDVEVWVDLKGPGFKR